MKKLILPYLVNMLWLAAAGQSQLPMRVDTSMESVAYWNKWAHDLYQKGIDKGKDSFFVREEVVKLMKDSTYRQVVYPASYEWPGAIDLLNKMELKKAFWHLINIYQSDVKHRDLILGSFVLYDSLMEMDKVLVSTFYTYAFADPRVCRIVNGKPDIFRPDLLEKGLATTKEITAYIWAYRKNRTVNK